MRTIRINHNFKKGPQAASLVILCVSLLTLANSLIPDMVPFNFFNGLWYNTQIVTEALVVILPPLDCFFLAIFS